MITSKVTTFRLSIIKLGFIYLVNNNWLFRTFLKIKKRLKNCLKLHNNNTKYYIPSAETISITFSYLAATQEFQSYSLIAQLSRTEILV